MLLKFLFNILFSTLTGTYSGLPNSVVEGSNGAKVNEDKSPTKSTLVNLSKDSVAQTTTPIVIFKLLNILQPKSNGTLKNAGKVAKTANNHSSSGKI